MRPSTDMERDVAFVLDQRTEVRVLWCGLHEAFGGQDTFLKRLISETTYEEIDNWGSDGMYHEVVKNPTFMIKYEDIPSTRIACEELLSLKGLKGFGMRITGYKKVASRILDGIHEIA